jgi:thiol:disulfide interchange protein DsbD
MVTPSFASKQNWQNDKIDINIYSKKNTQNNFNILVELKLKNDWFIYWDNPGDAGIPTTFSWNNNIKRIANSKPEKRIFKDIVAQYGYSGTAYYLFEGASDKDEISVNISWEACKDECEKENAFIEFTLSQNDDIIFDNVLEKARKTFPDVLNKPFYTKTS